MKKALIVLFSLIGVSAFAQSNTKVAPRGGNAAIQIVYYRIDFTQEELDYLRTHAAELIFSIDYRGKASLEKVNNIGMPSIVDRMMSVNDQLPEFTPETVKGIRQNGIYFLKLTWPNYQSNNQSNPGITYSNQNLQYTFPKLHKLSDFSEITYRSLRYDMTVGFMGASFSGNISSYLKNGWGTKFDFMFYGKNGWGGGLVTTLIFAKPGTHDPTLPATLQDRSHILALFTGAFGKISGDTRVGQFGIQLEPGFGITDIVNTSTSSSRTVVSMGFTPGIVGVYLLPLGKGRMGRQYYYPVASRQYLNFYLGARQLMFNTKESKGTVYEFGMSYRISTRSVASYKLKDGVN